MPRPNRQAPVHAACMCAAGRSPHPAAAAAAACRRLPLFPSHPSAACRCALQEVVKAPRKALYRMRAHSNPLNDASFPVPLSPAHCDWWVRQACCCVDREAS